MALHQHPSDLILLPAMHPNLAQIARTWVAKSLLINQIDNSALLPLLAPHNLEPSPALTMHSHPYHLVPWSTRGSTALPISHSSRSCTSKDILVVDSKTFPKKLNPQAPALILRDTMTKRHRNTMSNTTCNQPRPKTQYIAPTKRKNTVLPGQRLLSDFFPNINSYEINHPSGSTATNTFYVDALTC
jgi:hypothetical protein